VRNACRDGCGVLCALRFGAAGSIRWAVASAVPTPNRPFTPNPAYCRGGRFGVGTAEALVVVPRVTNSGHTVQGILILWKGASGSWSTCAGTGGYSDISAGGNVRITSGNGDTIGGGFLKNITEADLLTIVKMDRQGSHPIGLKSTDDPGAIDELRTFLSGLSNLSACALWWEVPNVPGASICGVEVTHRGVLDYNAAEMEKNGWVVSSDLGH